MTGSIVLLPRMDAVDVEELVEGLDEEHGPTFGIDATAEFPSTITFAPVGGRRVTAEELLDLRRRIQEVAVGAGYPEANTVEARSKFDSACARVLGTCELLQSGEAHRDDVWAFIATCLLTPITFWRYGASADRWHGGVRNTFQRLWLRARALDRGPDHEQRWGLIDALTEDALVAITERPALAAQRPLAVGIAEGWVRAAEAHGRARMQSIMREAIIMLRLKNEVTALAQLPSANLSAVVDHAFWRAAGALSAAPAKRTG